MAGHYFPKKQKSLRTELTAKGFSQSIELWQLSSYRSLCPESSIEVQP